MLALPAPESSAPGPETGRWLRAEDSTLPPEYAAMTLAPGHAAYEVVLDCNGTPVRLDVGDGEWVESTFVAGGVMLPVVAAGGWDGAGCFSADVRLIETPHTVRLRTRPDGKVHLGWREVPLYGADPLGLAVRGPGLPRQD
jgi:hypothetical protein